MVMGSGRLGWGVPRRCLGWSLREEIVPSVYVSFCVFGAFFVFLVSELRFVWFFLQYQW